MFGPTFSDYYSQVLDKIKQSVLREADSQILGSEIDDLADFYFRTLSLQTLEFNPADLTYEMKKEMRRVRAHERDRGYEHLGDTDWEFELAIISIPIQPNSNLDMILRLDGPKIYFDGFNQALKHKNNEIFYTFETKGYRIHNEDERIIHEINTKSDRLIKALTEKNSCISYENSIFLEAIKNLISERKSKLLADKERLDSLTQKIKIPLKQKIQPQTTRISVDTKKFVKIVKPTPKLPEEYTLEESILIDLLNFVDNQCKSFERTAGSYKSLGEEQLRDIILSALNGIFEGNATGETFVKNGKTDIHLKIDKGEILIFECKIWGGEKLYLDTIDQLIGYVTWRQNYGVVVMFCKNKDFSKILLQIPDIIQKHPQFIRGYRKISESHFVSENSLPEDTGKIIKIHHLIYNLYAD